MPAWTNCWTNSREAGVLRSRTLIWRRCNVLNQTRFHRCVFHYSDVIMIAIVSPITSLTIIYSIIKAPHHWPLCGEFTGDRGIPRTKGQSGGNAFIWWRHHVEHVNRVDVPLNISHATRGWGSPTITRRYVERWLTRGAPFSAGREHRGQQNGLHHHIYDWARAAVFGDVCSRPNKLSLTLFR